ncbi:MAG: TonB-dependent receptor [Acidobacteria bacterium]|nr:TonB-dependent receptor [Acidobacteriota bacterium]
MSSFACRHLFSLLLTCSFAYAQTSTGSIQGTITDPSNAVVPGADIVLTNVATNEKRIAKSTEMGYFSFTLLPPAGYRLDVQARGFKRSVRENITLNVAMVVAVPVLLELGASTETVSVDAQAPILEAGSSSLGYVMENSSIANLPINGRNAYGFATLVPGVRAARGFSQVSVGMYNEEFVSINGARANASNFQLDGGANSTPSFNGPALFPSVDMVQEYKVQVNNFSAEFSNTAGGVVNVVTKSGSNKLHGSLFEFLRNDKLTANNFFNNRAGLPVGAFRFNQFGASAGGPVLLPKIYSGKNRTFFFFAYEGLRWVQSITATGTMPTELERRGDFTQTRNAAGQQILVYDPYSSRPDPDRAGRLIRTPFNGNLIPLTRFDAVARNVARYFPLPNTTGALYTNNNNFISNQSSPIAKNTPSIRLDHSLNDNHKLFGRYSSNVTDFQRPKIYGGELHIAAPTRGPDDLRQWQTVINYTGTLSPTTVLELSSSYLRYTLGRTPPGYNYDPVQLGFPSYLRSLQPNLPPCFPQINTGQGLTWSVNEIGIGSDVPLGVCGALRSAVDAFQESANLTKNRGAHILKFGGIMQADRNNGSSDVDADGVYTFRRDMTQGPDPRVATSTAGVAFASFLLGTGSGGSIATGVPSRNYITKRFGAYFQDDWRITPSLTLNLGIRYDYSTPWTDRYNRLSNIDLTSTSALQVPGFALRGGLTFPGVNGQSRNLFNGDRNNFAPRLGFAYSMNRNTVLRGGYGIFTAPLTGSGQASDGFRARNDWVTSLDGVTPLNPLSNPFPNGFTLPTGNTAGLATLLGQGVSGNDRGMRLPYAQQWNLDLQRTLPGNLLIDAAYAGSRGVHLFGNLNMNQLPNDRLALGDALRENVSNPFFGTVKSGGLSSSTVSRAQLLRPYPQFTGVTQASASYGASTYHALQLRVERRFSQGLSILGSYTFSKLLDDVTMISGYPGDVYGGGLQDFNTRRNERAVAVFDATHNLAINTVWEMPFGRGKRFLSTPGILAAIGGGWQLNGIATFRSGAPLMFTSATNNPFNFGGAQRPDWVPGQNAKLEGPIQSRLTRYFNTDALVQPAPYTMGNVPRLTSNLRGPGIANYDLSLFKNIPLRESVSLQFRAEAFNAFNRVEFGLPNTAIGSPAAGTISAQVNQPRDFQFALKLLF